MTLPSMMRMEQHIRALACVRARRAMRCRVLFVSNTAWGAYPKNLSALCPADFPQSRLTRTTLVTEYEGSEPLVARLVSKGPTTALFVM